MVQQKEYRAWRTGSTQGRYILAKDANDAKKLANKFYGKHNDWNVKLWKVWDGGVVVKNYR